MVAAGSAVDPTSTPSHAAGMRTNTSSDVILALDVIDDYLGILLKSSIVLVFFWTKYSPETELDGEIRTDGEYATTNPTPRDYSTAVDDEGVSYYSFKLVCKYKLNAR